MSSSAAMFLSAIVLMVFAMDQILVLGQEYECLPLVWEVNTTIRSPVCSNFLPSARCCEGLSCESLIGCYPNPRQKGHPCSLNKPCTGDRCCVEGSRCQASATFNKPNTGLCVALPPTPIPTIAPTRRPTLAPSRTPSVTPTMLPTSKPTRRPTSAPSFSPTVTPTKLPTSKPTPTPKDAIVFIEPFPHNRPTSGPYVELVPETPPEDGIRTLRPTRQQSQVPSTSPTMQSSSRPSSSPSDSPTMSLSPTEHPTTAIFANRSNDFDELIYFGPDIVGPGWGSSDMGPLGKCAGDCDTDDDCRGLICDNDDNCRPGLICFQRSGVEDATVPGCAGTAEGDVDYCYDPSYEYPSAAPSLGPSVSPTSGPTKVPTRAPSTSPTTQPSSRPSSSPSLRPSSRPSSSPSLRPSSRPSSSPSASPTDPSAIINKETSPDPLSCPENPTQVNMGINEGANAQNTCSRSCECISGCCIALWLGRVCLPGAPNDFMSCMTV